MIVRDEVTREEIGHTYWNRQGFRVVGITELLAAMGYLGKGFFNHEALKRGKNVHLALHYYAKGTLEPASLSPRIKPYFDSAVELMEQKNAKVILSETLLFDPLSQIACQLDAVWKFPSGEQIVVDYKTGPVSEWVKYQTASHVNGLAGTVHATYRRWGLELRNDGKPARISEFKDERDMNMVRMFASVFYTQVNDGAVKWPRTKKDLDDSRRQDDGLELFGSIGTNDQGDKALRDGEGPVGALSASNGARATA